MSNEKFPDISATNLSRCLRWHPQGIKSWSMSDWCVALLGEIGEVAEVAERGSRVPQLTLSDDLRAEMADEIGDVYAYADLFAQANDLNFTDCINEVADFHHRGSLASEALAMAVAGGQLANVVKKLNRERDNLPGNKELPYELENQLFKFIGRIGQACQMLADRIGVPLQECVAGKFNRVSEKVGFPERL